MRPLVLIGVIALTGCAVAPPVAVEQERIAVSAGAAASAAGGEFLPTYRQVKLRDCENAPGADLSACVARWGVLSANNLERR